MHYKFQGKNEFEFRTEKKYVGENKYPTILLNDVFYLNSHWINMKSVSDIFKQSQTRYWLSSYFRGG